MRWLTAAGVDFAETSARSLSGQSRKPRTLGDVGLMVEAQRLYNRSLPPVPMASGQETPMVEHNVGRIFIGHGNSPIWRELKDFISERLHLPWDEFNRIPVAGVANTERLSALLGSSVMAFLVMTGEDEQPDGKLRARMNVIHEAGLFQGRLGFSKAIVVLEEGCEEFSNIEGLGQVRFPKDRIRASFDEIRQVLEREGIIGVS